MDWVPLAIVFICISNLFNCQRIRWLEERSREMTRQFNECVKCLKLLNETIKIIDDTKEDKIDLSNAAYDD